MMKIPITKPYFDQREHDIVRKPLETGWVAQGPYVANFERLVSDYSKIKYALAASSGTTALHLGLVAMGIGPDDEAILPAFSFVASANVIEFQLAKPVFCDIELDTFNIDISQIESKITDRTKAIMPVSLFGLGVDTASIMELAKKHNLYVIEDAACAIGAWCQGHHAGALADIAAISFHPRKTITTGEGGMVLTNNLDLFEKMRSLRNHGARANDLGSNNPKNNFSMPEYSVVGYNYRMTDLQGGLGVAQMEKLQKILKQRAKLAKRYDDGFSDLDWLVPPFIPEGHIHSYQSYVCLFQPEEPTMDNLEMLHNKRNCLMAKLEDRGISSRQGTQALHILEYYRNRYSLEAGNFKNALFADKLSLALPLYPQMTISEQDYVIDQIRAFNDY